MKLTNKEIDDVVISLAGDDTPPLIAILRNKKNISEFRLAERLNVTVNQIRNMLYRMHKHNLVTFTRKKDKKKGWYIYYWTLDMKNLNDARYDLKKKQLRDFNERLGKEEGSNFYVCPNKCTRLTMEAAMEVDFKCQECGSLMAPQENKRTIDNIRQRIAEIEADLKKDDDNRRLETEKKAKKAKRILAAERKAEEEKKLKEQKKAERIVRRAALAAKREAEARKKVKKTAKKAVKKAVPKKAVKKAVPKKAPKAAKKSVKKTVKKAPKPAKKPAAKPEKKGIFSKLKAALKRKK